MMLLQVGVILLAVGAAVAFDVTLPPASSNAEICATHNIDDDLPPTMNCIVYKDNQRDFHVQMGDRHISAHANAIAAVIPYFGSPSGDVQARINTLQQQNLEPDAVEALFRFVYTREIKIDDDNVDAVLRAAEFLQMEHIVAACVDLIATGIIDNNVVNRLNAASASNEKIILTAATQYFLTNIIRLSGSSDFENLTAAAFMHVVRANRTASEESIFEAILGWTRHDAQNRSGMLCDLMEKVRFCSMTFEYLTHDVQPQLRRITSCPRVRQAVREAINYQMLPDEQPRLNCGARQDDAQSERRHDNATFWTLQNDANSEMEVYEPAFNRSRVAGNGPNKDEYCVVAHDCNIYAIGGFDENGKSVHVYSETAHEWRAIEPMTYSRRWASAVVVNGKVYVCGGVDDEWTDLVSAESFDSRTRAWTSLASMHQARYFHRLVAIGDYLYAIGGRNDVTLGSVEKYEISRNVWTHVTAMLEPREGFGAAVLDGKIYVCGGYRSQSAMNSAEVFDPAHQRWISIAPKSSGSGFLSLVAYLDQLWAFPGYTKSSLMFPTEYTKSRHVYDPKSNTWTQHAYALEGESRMQTVLMQC